MTTRISELFGLPTGKHTFRQWKETVLSQRCPFLGRQCLKVRKSQPEISIGTCSVQYGKQDKRVIICPYRFIEGQQVFTDCLHLLALHEPGNELHVVSEISVPGGSVDYFVVSAKSRKVKDFVGVELQTLDTTGTLWPERQRFLRSVRLSVRDEDVQSTKGFGMNWKMTAKTILVQLHHKIQTFEGISKHLVLVIQDCLLEYMRREFSFAHLEAARVGDPMHIHAYSLDQVNSAYNLNLRERLSTDTAGISTCLGLQVSANVELESIIELLEQRISNKTLLMLATNRP